MTTIENGVDARQVAADTVLKLINAKVIPEAVRHVRRALDVLGLTRDDLADALARQEARTTIPLRSMHAPAPNDGKRTGAGTRARQRAKNPTPGTRICSRCGDELPLELFPVKNRTTGTLKSWCRPCLTDYQKDRYLTVEKAGAVLHALEFTVLEGDSCVGSECEWCKQLIEVGQRVKAEGRVEHVVCPK